MTYETPQALEMALKSAARNSPMDTGRAISGFYFHRLLCRVFSDPRSPFLLKGGQGMLARTTDARATRDIDLLFEPGDLDAALEELKRLASSDLGDFVTFEFAKATSIKVEDEYRHGLNATFNVYLGAKKVQPVCIDLVVDEVPQDGFDTLTPVDRVDLAGLTVCDYRVYTVESALADKLFGIIETHRGRPSSRVKDLVDIAVYALSETVEGEALTERLYIESKVRGLDLPIHFAIPSTWWGLYDASFKKSIQQTGVASRCQDFDDAEELAAKLLGPALNGTARGKIWNPATEQWEEAEA